MSKSCEKLHLGPPLIHPLPIGLGVALKFTSPALEQPVLAAPWLLVESFSSPDLTVIGPAPKAMQYLEPQTCKVSAVSFTPWGPPGLHGESLSSVPLETSNVTQQQ